MTNSEHSESSSERYLAAYLKNYSDNLNEIKSTTDSKEFARIMTLANQCIEKENIFAAKAIVEIALIHCSVECESMAEDFRNRVANLQNLFGDSSQTEAYQTTKAAINNILNNSATLKSKLDNSQFNKPGIIAESGSTRPEDSDAILSEYPYDHVVVEKRSAIDK